MQRRDYYLLAARTICTASAFASFFLTPLPSQRHPMLASFVAIKGSNFFGIFMGVMMLGSHVCSLKNWMDMGPQEYFSYPFVFTEGALAVIHLGSATAALGVITHPRFFEVCLPPICWRNLLSCGLALLMGALSVANAVVLLSARVMSNGPRLLAILAGGP